MYIISFKKKIGCKNDSVIGGRVSVASGVKIIGCVGW